MDISSNKHQYGYINGIEYSITNIILNNMCLEPIFDANGNKLILCKGTKIRPYLRRYVETSNRMTEWHKEWQSHFSNTETTFSKINEEQIKNRRTDVDLNDNIVIEFQHSLIQLDEVINRQTIIIFIIKKLYG